MDWLGYQLAAAAGLLCVVFVGPFTAYFFVMRRKRKVRERRKSPLTADLLRAPGQALRDELEDLRVGFAFDLGMLMLMPAALVATYLLFVQIRGAGHRPWVIAALAIGLLVFMVGWIRKLLSVSEELDKRRIGLDAELAVGQELDQLMRRGAVVFHDLPAEHFNVDHVMVAEQGVFAIETKGRSKPSHIAGPVGATVVYDGQMLKFPDSASRKPIEQAERQAQWLQSWLTSATGEPVAVTPVVALPGWFVEWKGRGPVKVLSGKQMYLLLKDRPKLPLSPAQVQRIAHQLEQRCRNVKPTYRADEKAA
jgi:hypothetical protein